MSGIWRPYGSDGPTLGELLRQALSSTDHGYDLLAERFDHTPFRTPRDAAEKAVAVVDDVLRAERPLRVLDICCGTGAGLLAVVARAAAVSRTAATELVGVDRSTGMLAEARRRVASESPSSPPSLLSGDALALPVEAASVDVAVTFGAHGHILERDEPRFVSEVARVLKPGGHFVFITADPPPLLSKRHLLARGFNAAMRVRNFVLKPEFIMYYLTFLAPRARRLLEEAGFDVREHRDVVNGYVVVDAVKSSG
jgi:ubiquinone/menaquinone biosynthesis C-methylase UbiE